MPYATDVVKFTMFGTIRSVQSWSAGMWWGTSGFPAGFTYGQDQINGLRDSTDLQGYWNTFMTHFKEQLSSRAVCSGIRYDLYSGNSRASKATAEYIPASPWTGSSDQVMPSEVALCFSAYTGDPGPSGRGRFYWPVPGASLATSTGGFDISTATTLLTDYSTFVAAVAAHSFDDEHSGTYGLYPSLASWEKGTNHAVTTLKVDTRFDSQRRRENKLPVSRVSIGI